MDKHIPLRDKRVIYTLSRLECGLPVDTGEFHLWAHQTYQVILEHYATCDDCMDNSKVTPCTMYNDTMTEMLKMMSPGNRLVMTEDGYKAAEPKMRFI